MQTLTNLQIELLKIYSHKVSDETLYEIKTMLAKYFADKASDEMDKVWEENELNEKIMVDWTKEHNRINNFR